MSTVEIFDGSTIVSQSIPPPTEGKCTQLISQLCQHLLKSMEYGSVVEFIATHFMNLTHSEGACIYSKKTHSKFGCHALSTSSSSISACACSAAQHIQRIIISSDIAKDPRFSHLEKHSSRCIILFPLHYRDEVIGSLLLSRPTPYNIDDVVSILPLLEICGKFVYKAGHSKSKKPSIQQLKDVDDVKDKFLATMSHELRTPLNGIVGMVTLLESAGTLTTKQREYVGILMECSHQLMNLMNNILDFSKMSSGRLVLSRTPFSVTKTIRDSILIASAKAKDRGLDFKVMYRGNPVDFNKIEEEDVLKDQFLPFMIGDSQRLMQILINLLTNAVKFTEKGGVVLRVNAEQSPDATNTFAKKWKLSFDVEDTGIGIPPEEQALIFQVFHQSPTLSEKVSKSGTGLGLSIAKELVKLMGGSISVTSSGIKGAGTTFSFYVLLDEELTLASTSADYSKLFKKARILVVDDRQENRLQIAEMLFKWKCIPTILSSGEEALQYLKHDDKFSVALIDICMPYMSGIDLAQELRSRYPGLSLIGLSSLDITSGKEIFDQYLTKPIDQSVVFPAILGCLMENKKRRGSYCNSSSSSLPPPPPEVGRKKKPRAKLRILIAEDDKNNAYTIQEMLYHLGYSKSRIRRVENGEECLKVLSEGRHRYDVVLLDILMPVMDGIETAKHIRQTQPHPYIVAVSAAVQKSDKQRCQSVGIDSYLTKPILIDRLAATLDPLIVDGSKQRPSV